MEELPKNIIYFIFCIKGNTNTVEKIETNTYVRNIKKIKEIKDENNIYTIYCLILSNDCRGTPFTLTLVDHSGVIYMSYVFSKINEKFKYNLIFEPVYADKNKLNQIINLSYKDQFEIFKKYLDSKTDLNYLLLNAIENVSQFITYKLDHYFLLYFFFEIYNLPQKNQNNDDENEEEIDKNKLMTTFFEKINFDKFFEQCLKEKEKSDDKNEIIIMDDSKYNIRENLVQMTGNIIFI